LLNEPSKLNNKKHKSKTDLEVEPVC
jgi:hypothetical protein